MKCENCGTEGAHDCIQVLVSQKKLMAMKLQEIILVLKGIK